MTAMAVSSIPQHLNPGSSSAPSSAAASSSSALQTSTPTRPPRSRPSPHSSPRQPSSPRSNSPRAGSLGGGMDVDGALKAHGGDAKRALDSVLAERNSLSAQNAQLWKLIEKQRSSSSQLIADNERLRAERDRANARLVDAGLEPVNGKRLPHSSSAAGLGLKPEPPSIRRHNSDREDRPSLPPVEQAASQPAVPSSQNASESNAPVTAPSPLLPSPMTEAKLRRESRMAFPPEISSFMTLADSPRLTTTHTTSPQPVQASTSFNTLSPASQYSASPSVSSVRGGDEPSALVPPSSRVLAMQTDIVEEPEEEQRAALADVPPRGSSMRSPPLPLRQLSFSAVPSDSTSDKLSMAPSDELSRPSLDSSSRLSDEIDTPRASLDPVRQSPLDHSASTSRQLSRLNPSLLPHTRISIPSSTVFPNQTGRDVLCFIVSITIRPPNSPPTQWNVAKLFSAFLDLDTKIKAKSSKSRKEWKTTVTPLPEGRAWKDFAPSKIDQRKRALEAYLQSLLIAPISDKSDLCEFLSTDQVQAKTGGAASKEGYLTKKGKNFGGWKTRFFVLQGPVMEYYETRGGTHLGSIVITNAQIGRQNRPADATDDRDFRHAFLIIEQGKRGATTRHVLCAESDMERDAWIEVLVQHVEPERGAPAPPLAPVTQSGLARKRSNSRKQNQSKGDIVVSAAAPMASLPTDKDSKFAGAPSPSLINQLESKRNTMASSSTPSLASTTTLPPYTPRQTTTASDSQGSQMSNSATTHPRKSGSIDSLASTSQPSIQSHASQPRTMITSPSSEVLSSSPPNLEPTPRASKRQSIMPSRSSHLPSSHSHSAAYLSKLSSDGMTAPPGLPPYTADKERDRKAKSGRFWPSFGNAKAPEKPLRPVFAVQLTDSIAVACVAGLPAIVFRCIEWLEAKRAEEEEGIYRLSGSSAVIKGLKDRFDAEGDVNLLKVDEHWDPHAIAGLLKTFLRDLPTSLLTRELHPQFLAVMDLIDSAARVAELSRLVSDLPPANYTLLRALTAHLILIVANAHLNKMTLRNIGIVFSPTLGIPAGIFSDLVSHFGQIFDDEEGAAAEDGSGEGLSVPMDRGGEGGGAGTDETVKSKRNSMLYQQGGADVMLGLKGRALNPSTEDSASEAASDDLESEATPSLQSSENVSISSHQTTAATPRQELYPSAAAVRKAKAAARAQERGLNLRVDDVSGSNGGGGGGMAELPRTPVGQAGGLPVSPRPGGSAGTSPRVGSADEGER